MSNTWQEVALASQTRIAELEILLAERRDYADKQGRELAEERERGVAYLESLLEINPQATLASTLDLIRATRPVDYGPSLTRIAELERENVRLQILLADQRDIGDKMLAEIAELKRELALTQAAVVASGMEANVLEWALRLACEDIALIDYARPRGLSPGALDELLTDNQVAYYMKWARRKKDDATVHG